MEVRVGEFAFLSPTIWRVTADLATPGRHPNPQLWPLKWRRHIWSGTESINREMFTRWLEVLSLMWFQVFQWSPQRALRQIPRPAKLWGKDALGVQAGSRVRAESWERLGSLQAAPDLHYLG